MPIKWDSTTEGTKDMSMKLHANQVQLVIKSGTRDMSMKWGMRDKSIQWDKCLPSKPHLRHGGHTLMRNSHSPGIIVTKVSMTRTSTSTVYHWTSRCQRELMALVARVTGCYILSSVIHGGVGWIGFWCESVGSTLLESTN